MLRLHILWRPVSGRQELPKVSQTFQLKNKLLSTLTELFVLYFLRILKYILHLNLTVQVKSLGVSPS